METLVLTGRAAPVRLGAVGVGADRGLLHDDAVAKPGLYTKALAVCTSNFKRSSEVHHEKGNTFAVLNITLLRLVHAGYISAPYEPRGDTVHKKQRKFFTEKNAPAEGVAKPTPTMELTDDRLVCRSFEQHPTPALRTRARGEVTEPVGVLLPGMSMVFFVHDDSKERTIADAATEDGLVPQALLLVELDMRMVANCATGNGMILRKVALVPSGSVHAATLWARTLWYTDREEIRAQSCRLMEQAVSTQKYASDLAFIGKMVVATVDPGEELRERPAVVLSADKTQHVTLDVLPNNVHIRARINDADSIYTRDDMVLYVDPGEFSLPNTSIAWLCSYYTWCLEAGVASVVVLHNEYMRQKAREGDGAKGGMYAVVAVRHEELFARGTPLELSPDEVAVLEEKVHGGLDESKFAAWIVRSGEGNKRYAVVMDYTKERTILPDTSGAAGGGELDPVEATHNSPVCDIYPGMNPARKVWLAYLCTLDGAGGVEALPVGIQTHARAPGGGSRASALALPSGTDYRELLT